MYIKFWMMTILYKLLLLLWLTVDFVNYKWRVLIGCPAALWLAEALLCCNELDLHRKEWLAQTLESFLPCSLSNRVILSNQDGRFFGLSEAGMYDKVGRSILFFFLFLWARLSCTRTSLSCPACSSEETPARVWVGHIEWTKLKLKWSNQTHLSFTLLNLN